MVAIVSGNTLGLLGGSSATLGQQGAFGAAGIGKSQENGYLNVSNGNIVMQQRDDFIASRGIDLSLTRTYNAQGALGQHWKFGLNREVSAVTGVVNGAGSTVVRIAGDGSEALYRYDEARGVYVSADGAGAYSTLAYDAATQRWTWSEGDGQVREVYDAAQHGRILSSADENNHQLSYFYDANSGWLSRVVTASGDTSWFEYSNGDLTQVREVLANGAMLTRVRYGYDAQHRLTSVSTDLSPEDNSIADGDAAVTRYAYDGDSERIATVTQADGTALSFTYQQYGSDWRVASVTDGLGRRTQLAYDLAANTTRVTDALGTVSVYAYDAQGQLTSVKTPAAQHTYVYDEQGNLIRSADAAGNVVEMQYDANGNQILQRDALGNTITRTYDPVRNLLLTESTALIADANGAVPGQAQTVRYVYDAAGRLRFQLTPQGRVAEYRYNANGERVASIEYAGNGYDVGTLSAMAVPLEAQLTAWVDGIVDKSVTLREEYEYDARGLLIRATSYGAVDAAGLGVVSTQMQQRYVYDQSGRMLQSMDGTGQITRYTYDINGRLLSSTDPQGNVTLTSYDADGRQVVAGSTSAALTTSVYDRTGAVLSVMRNNAAGQELDPIDYSYDVDGRLQQTSNPSQHPSVIHDQSGRVAWRIDEAGAPTQIQYDGKVIKTTAYAHRLTSDALAALVALPDSLPTPQADALRDVVSYQLLDDAGNVIYSIDAGGKVIEQRYDERGNVVVRTVYAHPVDLGQPLSLAEVAQQLQAGQDAAADIRLVNSYDAANRLAYSADVNGFVTQYLYDQWGNLAKQVAYARPLAGTAWNPGDLSAVTAGTGDRIRSFVYNDAGQKVYAIDVVGTVTQYWYDGAGNVIRSVLYANQLVSFVDRGSIHELAHVASQLRPDSLRDIVGMTVVDSEKRLSYSIDVMGYVTRLAKDADGRVIQSVRYALPLRAFNSAITWTVAQLEAALQPDPAVDTVETNTYDAFGNLVKVTDGAGRARYNYYDQQQRLVLEVSAQGNATSTTYSGSQTQVMTSQVAVTLLSPATVGVLPEFVAIGNAMTSRTAYDRAGRLVEMFNGNISIRKYEYDGFGDRVRMIDSLGRFTDATYDARGLQFSMTYPRTGLDATGVLRPVVNRLTYDFAGRLTQQITSVGLKAQESREYEYDLAGKVTQQTFISSSTRIVTDALGRVVALTDVQGVVTLTTYAADGGKTISKEVNGEITLSEYDARGRLVRETLPRTGADASGALHPVINTYSYDAAGRMTQEVFGVGLAAQKSNDYVYDQEGNFLQRIFISQGTRYVIDALGREVLVVGAEGEKVTTYGTDGGRTESRTLNGKTTVQEYDAYGWVIRETLPETGKDASGALRPIVNSYTYDAARNLTQKILSVGLLAQERTDNVYDETGKLVQRTYAGYGSRTIYDGLGRPVSHTDVQGNVTLTSYEADGGTTVSRTVNGETTLYGYDQAGRLIKLVTSSINERYVYGENNQRAFVIDGAGKALRYVYNTTGQVEQTIQYASSISVGERPTLQEILAALKPAPALDIVTNFANGLPVPTVREDRGWHMALPLQRWGYDQNGNRTPYVDTSGNSSDSYLNLSNGNVVLRQRDDVIAAHGIDLALGRAYNAQGGGARQWTFGVSQSIGRIIGVVNGAGSTVLRTAADGSQAAYAYDSARGMYVSTDGAGAYRTLAYDAVAQHWTWIAGDGQVREVYDATQQGRIILSADTSNNQLSYYYDAGSGQLSRVVTASGDTTWFDYSNGDLGQVRDVLASGAVLTRVRYGYDTQHRLTSVTTDLTPDDNSIADGKVAVIRYTYDGISERIASLTQADGTALSFTYQQYGSDWRVASVTDGLGRLTQLTYDPSINSTCVTDALGAVSEYIYDAQGQLIGVTTPAGQQSSYVYDAQGNLIRSVDARGNAVEMQYDANGNQILQRDALGNTITRTYDPVRNLLLTETTYQIADPDGAGPGQPGRAQTVRYVYDVAGHLRFQISAVGRTIEYRYNAKGERIASVQYAADLFDNSGLASTVAPSEAEIAAQVVNYPKKSQTVRLDYEYDARGLLARTLSYGAVDAAGVGIAATQVVQRYVYDQAGQLLQSIDTAGAATSYTYDGLGRLLSTTDPLGHVTLNSYDAAGGRMAVRLANGLTTTSVYNKAGELTDVIQTGLAGEELGRTSYAYDADGRLRMTTGPTGQRSYVLYDGAGRKAADITAGGTLTQYKYDANNQLIRTLRYAQAVSSVNLARLVAADGSPLAATLAQAGLLPPDSDKDQSEWRLYDAAGRLVRTVGAMGAMGAVTEYVYDGVSKLIQTIARGTLLDLTAFMLNPVAGNAVVAASADDRITWRKYDADGLLRYEVDGERYMTEYRYDSAGRQVSTVRYANQVSAAALANGSLAQAVPAAHAQDIVTATAYNGRGLVDTRTDGEGYVTSYTYDAAARLAETRQGNRRESFSYDAHGRLSSSVRYLDGGATETAMLSYDSVGNVTGQTRAGVGAASRYDLQGRLIGELAGKGSAALAALGGSPSAAQVDAVWQAYGVRYTYDKAGLRIAQTDVNGNRTLYLYDADARLTHAVNALGEIRETVYNVLGETVASVAYGTRLDAGTLANLQGGMATPGFKNAVLAIANVAKDSRTSYSYFASGALASSGDALGKVTTYGVNAFGEQVSRLTPIAAGVALLIETSYDRRGQVTGEVRERAGLNQTSVSRYDAFGRLAASVDANQVTHSYDYDRNGRLVLARDGLQQAALTSYDAYGNVLTQTDRLGQVTRYSYTAFNRAVTVTTPEGLVTVSSVDAQGRKIALRDAQGVTSTYHYDLDGNLDATKVAEGTLNLSSTNSYDAAGRLTESIDAGGRKVRYEYDAANRLLTRRVDPDGLNLRTSYQYDAKGQQIQVTDPAGVVTQTEFDLNGKVLKQIADPQGLRLTTQYAYDDAGRVLSVTSPGGLLTSYVYDKLGRRTEQHVDPAGQNLSTLTGYDAKGNVVSAKDPNGNVTRYLYDANDRVALVVDARGGVTQTLYDKNGNVAQSIGYAKAVAGLTGNETAQQILSLVVRDTAHDLSQVRRYDKDGRLSWSVDGTGAVVRTEYDGKTVKRTAYANRLDAAALAALAGGATSAPAVAAGRDVVTQQLFDAAGRLVYSIDGVGALTEQRYDGSGNAIVRVVYATAINITQPLTLANVAQQLATLAQPARDARLVSNYDGAGRLTYSADAQGAVTQYIYDKAGNLTRQIAYATALAVPVADNAVLSGVAQSAADRISSFTYDALGRQVYAVDAMGGVTRRMYDNAGNVVRSTAYGVQLAALLERNSVPDTARILALLPLDTLPASHVNRVFDSANRLLYSVDALSYVTQNTYDANGHVTRVARYANAVTVAVPAASGSAMTMAAVQGALRLDAARDVAESRKYDAAGRLQEQTRAAGSAAAGTIQYAYDALGNITSITNERGYVTRQEFDQAGRKTLTSVPLDATSWAVTRTSYDAFGNAVKVTDPKGNAGYFYYDQQNRLVLQVNPLGYAVGTSYTLSGKPVTVTEYKTALTGTWSAEVRPTVIASAGDAITRLEYDRNDRLLASTDAEGAVERFDYDALGNRSSYQNKLRGMTRYTYDGRGALLTETLPVNAPDASGVSKPVINSYTYDAFGNRITSVEAQGLASQRSTTYGYDLAGRLRSQRGDEITLHDSNGTPRRAAPQQAWTYDQRGNKTSYTDGNGNVTRWYYDAADRKQMELSAAGTLSQWRYDAAGNMISALVYNTPVSAPAGNVSPQPVNPTERRQTYYVYDQANRMIGTKVGNSKEEAAINGDPVIKVQWAEPNQGGGFGLYDGTILTSRAYDALGNVVSESDGRGTVSWSYYNTAGVKTAQVDGKNYLTVWTRDAAGNILQEYRYANPVSLVVNAARSVEELKASSGTSVDDRITVSTYDRMNRVKTQSTLNQEVFSLDTKGALSSQTRATAVAYDYDGLGNIIRKTEANGEVSDSSYDALGRQTRTEGAGFIDFQQAWVRPTTDTVYDGVGNVITSTALGKTRAEDRITRFSYDAAGILTGKSTDGITGGYVYRHDAVGNVTEVQVHGKKADGSASVSRTLIGYDAMGKETRRQSGLADGAAGDSREVRYNAFGDIVFKGVNGGTAEFAEYDNMGRRWKTNAGDGSTKVYQYDQNGNATILIQSSGANLRPMTLNQIMKVNEGQGSSTDPLVVAAKAAGGISITLSAYDKRNQLTDTYQATMKSSYNFVTDTPFLTQELGANFTAGGLTVGATRESGGNVTNMPAVTGSIGYSSYGTVGFNIAWTGNNNKAIGEDFYDLPQGSIVTIPPGLANGPGKLHIRINDVDIKDAISEPNVSEINWEMLIPKPLPAGFFSNFRVELLQEVQEGATSSLILLAATTMSAPAKIRLDPYTYERRGSGLGAFGTQINIRNQPTSTDRLVFMARPAGVGTAWHTYKTDRTYNSAGGSIAGWFQVTELPSPGSYEFQYIALGVDGTVLNAESGVFDSAQGNSTLTQTPQPINGVGKAFLASDERTLFGGGGKIWFQITEQGKAQSMRFHYRQQGINAAWQSVMLEAVPGVPGWFKVPYNTPGVTEYWFETYAGANGSGAQVNAPGGGRTMGTFSYPSEASLLKTWNTSPARVSFDNQPANAVRMNLVYTLRGGGTGSIGLNSNGANSFIWDASSVAPDAMGDYVVDYAYESFDANGQRVNAAKGELSFGEHPKLPTHNNVSQPSIVSFTPPIPAATQLVLQYRNLGSTGAYTKVVLPRSGDKFIWKVEDAGLRPQSGSNSFEYSYTLLDAAGQQVTGGKPTYDGVVEVKADRNTSVSNSLWTISLKSAEATIHRQQAYNAFGEIASETDGRNNVVTLSYNTAGKLTRKEAPMTTIALENGSSTPGRPVTLYYYDASSQLIGVRDANNNLNTQTLLPGYGSEGRIVSEFHADGGVKTAGYDVFGDLRIVTDELQRKTQNRYDQGGRLIEVIRPRRLEGTPGFNNGIPNVDTYTYDTQGNRISHTNAYNQTESTDYDAEGRVLRTLSFEQREVRYSYTYDAAMLGVGGLAVGGWKKVTTVGNARSTSDSNDYFGHLVGHVDVAGRNVAYSYDHAAHLIRQTSTAGQNIDFEYYANGYLKRSTDRVLNVESYFEYDKEGNRTREAYAKLEKDGQRTYYQLADISYDELNRVVKFVDPEATITYSYDANSNRRQVKSVYNTVVNGAPAVQEYWYQYDSMNRFTITKGVSANGMISTGSTGTRISYDLAGQRLTATAANGTVERYSYTSDGYLEDVTINGVLGARRENDLRGRVTVYMEYKNGAKTSQKNTSYDYDNRILQESYTDTVTWKTTVTDFDYRLDVGNGNYTGVDQGVVTHTFQHAQGVTNTGVHTMYSYVWWDEAKQSQVQIQGINAGNPEAKRWASGFSDLQYDVNGHLTRMNAYEAGSLGAVVGSASSRTMTYISDQYGQVLRRNKTLGNGNLEVAHRFYYMNGHTVGDVSSEGPSTISYAEELAQRGLTTPGGFRNAKPVSSADFDQNYQPINSSYPGATASAYTVRKGDTLGSIARAVWGDESLWYLLADANGLTISDTLIEGQVLTVPNKVSNFHNNASTFKVYNAGQAIGDTMPVLPPEPMPPPPPQQSKGGGGCGVMGKLIMVVVAVAVTYMTMGAAATAAGAMFGAGTTAATVATGAIAGALGSVASQTVGMAIGAQDGFNWNGVALGALGGAVTAGVMNTGMGPTFSPGTSAFTRGVVQGGISNTITQGVAVATGLQHSFDWRGVAAGAIAGGVFAEVGNAIGQAQYGEQGWANLNGLAQDAKDAALWSDIGKTMARGAASGMAAGMASGLVRGGSLRNSFPGIMQDVIASTVGNAIGLGAQVAQTMAEGAPNRARFTESVASLQENPFGLPLRNYSGTSDAQDGIDYLQLLDAGGTEAGGDTLVGTADPAQTSRSFNSGFYANALQNRLIPTTVIREARWTQDQKIAFDVVERMSYAAQQTTSAEEHPTLTLMDDYAGPVTSHSNTSLVMSYGEQMKHVAMVMLGVGKGAFNGVPKFVMGTLNTLGEWSIMTSLQEIGVDPYKSGVKANKLTSQWNTGEFLSYNSVEERIGGVAGELISPMPFSKSINGAQWVLRNSGDYNGIRFAGQTYLSPVRMYIVPEEVGSLGNSKGILTQEMAGGTTYKQRVAQTPISNGSWSGLRGESTFTSTHPDVVPLLGDRGIKYNNAYPDFGPVVIYEVEIANMTANRAKNFAQADAALAGELSITKSEVKEWRYQNSYTWHEVQDLKTVQLMHEKINGKFGHVGGVGEINAGKRK